MRSNSKRDRRLGRNPVKDFFSWWIAELAGIAQVFTRPKSGPAENLLLALLQGERISFFWRDGSGWRELGAARIESSRTEIGALIDTVTRGKQRIIARLPGEFALRRRLTLPLAGENDLRQILTYQLDSLSPYPPDQIYFGYRVASRDYAAKTIEVEICLIPRSDVERLIDKMRSWNLVPDCVDCADQDELADTELNLLPRPLTPVKQRSLLSRFNKLLLATNLLLAALLVTGLLVSKAQREGDIRTRVETAKLKADAAVRLRDRVEKLEAQASFLKKTKKQAPPVLELIDELSSILPDGTWLERAVYRKNEITLSGISSKASVLIGEIERSPLFESVTFQSSVVQDDRSGGERFQIKAKITTEDSNVE